MATYCLLQVSIKIPAYIVTMPLSSTAMRYNIPKIAHMRRVDEWRCKPSTQIQRSIAQMATNVFILIILSEMQTMAIDHRGDRCVSNARKFEAITGL